MLIAIVISIALGLIVVERLWPANALPRGRASVFNLQSRLDGGHNRWPSDPSSFVAGGGTANR